MAKTYGVSTWNGERIKGDLRKYNILGLERAAKVIEDDMRARCPVETGQLRSSIHSFVDEENLTAFVNAGDKKAWYAHLVEFGTARRAIKYRRATKGTAAGTERTVSAARAKRLIKSGFVEATGRKQWIARAHPFVRPAFDSKARAAQEAHAAEVRKALK